MPEDVTTKPTLETVLERINALGDKSDSFHEGLESKLDSFREEIGIRLDRIESVTNATRAEMLTLRADFREFRASRKETA